MSTATTASAPAPKRTHTASLLCGSDATPERPVDAFWPASRASWPEAQQPSQGVLHLASPHRSPPTLSTLNGTAVKNVPSNAPSCNPLTAGSPTRQPYGAAEIASASKLSNQPPEEEWVNIHTVIRLLSPDSISHIPLEPAPLRNRGVLFVLFIQKWMESSKILQLQSVIISCKLKNENLNSKFKRLNISKQHIYSQFKKMY